MKCKVCGAESGKYPLCRACNIKKEKGEILKCDKCGNWHYVSAPCPIVLNNDSNYLYNLKSTLISKSEQNFFDAIKNSVPDGYYVFPQINLASFIERTDNSRFHNELFRNVDFLITDSEYKPKIIIEINDQSHLTTERKERDEKVQKICEEAGIPILKLWTSYGINREYIKGKLTDIIDKLPINRTHHFTQTTSPIQATPYDVQPLNDPSTIPQNSIQHKKKGCYVATCVYGSYNCPEVWILRRFRDNVLSKTCYGKLFIKIYYHISPFFVKKFGKYTWFIKSNKFILDKIINNLSNKGFENTPYNDN